MTEGDELIETGPASVLALVEAEPARASVGEQAAVGRPCEPFTLLCRVYSYRLHVLTTVDVCDQHPAQLRIV